MLDLESQALVLRECVVRIDAEEPHGPDHALAGLTGPHTAIRDHSRFVVEMEVSTPDGGVSARIEASGPFDAMAAALRRCLAQSYPEVADVPLVNYRVRVLDPGMGTAANVRVLINSAEHASNWTTAASWEGVLESSWNALCDFTLLELLCSPQAVPVSAA